MAAVDRAAAERELADGGGLRSLKRVDVGEPRRDVAVVGGAAGDVEAHHACGAAGAETVEEGDLAADRVAGEVDDES